jgi:hypothetical protein
MLNFIRKLFGTKLENVTIDIPMRETETILYTYSYAEVELNELAVSAVFDMGYIEVGSLEDLVGEVTGSAE